MSKKRSRLIAAAMLVFALVFFTYALTHPTASFPWDNTITYSLYIAYLVIMAVLFAAPFKNRR